jgi:hypothetical protein
VEAAAAAAAPSAHVCARRMLPTARQGAPGGRGAAHRTASRLVRQNQARVPAAGAPSASRRRAAGRACARAQRAARPRAAAPPARPLAVIHVTLPSGSSSAARARARQLLQRAADAHVRRRAAPQLHLHLAQGLGGPLAGKQGYRAHAAAHAAVQRTASAGGVQLELPWQLRIGGFVTTGAGFWPARRPPWRCAVAVTPSGVPPSGPRT